MSMNKPLDNPAVGHPSSLNPARTQLRTAAAFMLVALIWGSTWLVIKHQIASVPAGWAITWRFAIACPFMFLLAWWRGDGLRLSGEGARLAVLVGVAMFCGNFQFVYRAEQHLTSGVVAVLYALLMVPNALFSRVLLGVRVSGGFIVGSLVAMAGIGLLLVHEYRLAPPTSAVPLGLAMTLAALLCASAGNVLQATAAGHRQPLVPMIAWAMLAGACADAALAWATTGAPVVSNSLAVWAGTAYLALAGSVVTFPLYFALIRTMGAGRAAYNGVAVPVIAMGLSTLFEGYRWSLLAGSGATLALAGLLIALWARK
jgi:drug/metabolite transporter (DMT)-like permease